jgi:predicted transcriptional regulator of viral defense system
VSRPLSLPFFSAHPVFNRTEYAAAVGRKPNDKVVTAMLAQHARAGNIRRLARGLFAAVPKHGNAQTWTVDRFAAASKLRQGSFVAYHSALELHGYAYTDSSEVQLIAPGEPRHLQATGFSCRFIKPPRGFSHTEGVTTVDRLGLAVPVTTVERTIVDVFDRYDLAGGAEELFNSLNLVERVNPAALLNFARPLHNALAAGALGYWLETQKERLGIPDMTLTKLHNLAPKQLRYALGAKPGKGKTAPYWNVILPAIISSPSFEGL